MKWTPWKVGLSAGLVEAVLSAIVASGTASMEQVMPYCMVPAVVLAAMDGGYRVVEKFGPDRRNFYSFAILAGVLGGAASLTLVGLTSAAVAIEEAIPGPETAGVVAGAVVMAGVAAAVSAGGAALVNHLPQAITAFRRCCQRSQADPAAQALSP